MVPGDVEREHLIFNIYADHTCSRPSDRTTATSCAFDLKYGCSSWMRMGRQCFQSLCVEDLPLEMLGKMKLWVLALFGWDRKKTAS
mmetsp:Transcript_32654/g.76238  ORF Transcript_32654/g.76238 Transcript_32654/m.76238 type:complete len:86 (+) Transcript_32654:164-421(+)